MSSKTLTLKETGNKCLSEGNYAEAMLHYTHAIKLDPNQYKLYSNRSLAFRKLQQYHYAYEDAKEVIRLKPEWSKGYYRKGEVEAETGHYLKAIESYRCALQYDHDDDPSIHAAIKLAKDNSQKQYNNDHYIPWLATAIGLVVGMAIIACDHVFNNGKPIIEHPLLKMLVIMAFPVLLFYMALLQRRYLKNYRDNLLKPPPDLFKMHND